MSETEHPPEPETAAASPEDAQGRRRGRPPATGRYESREELLEAVWVAYDLSHASPSVIARQCGVSPAVVSKIVNTGEGRPPRPGFERVYETDPDRPNSRRLVGILRPSVRSPQTDEQP